MKLHESVTNKRSIKRSLTIEADCNIAHGNKYYYSKSVYKKLADKIIIICPIHGDFEQVLGDHLRKNGCPKCAREAKKTSKEEFIEKATEVHGNIYDYSLLPELFTSLDKVPIICKIHGTFFQQVSSHKRECGCPECGKERTIAFHRDSKEDFIYKANKTHDYFYSYSKVKYINSIIKVTITCPIHGDFQQAPGCHTLGAQCAKCVGGVASNLEEFIKKANKVHKNKFDYTEFDYRNNYTPGTIICPEHGRFLQQPNNHLQGKVGCAKCLTHSGFNKTLPSILYYLKVTFSNKVLYKIGITNRTIEERFGSDMQYITILHQIHYPLGETAYNEEQRILKKFKQYKYNGPDILKSGNTELFTKNVFHI